jgi:hypothetical protein
MHKSLLRNRFLVFLSIPVSGVLLLAPEFAQAGPCSANIIRAAI